MTGEYPTQRDGERRTAHERRKSVRFWRRLRQVATIVGVVSGGFYSVQKISDVAKGAYSIAVAGNKLTVSVDALQTQVTGERATEDSLVANQELQGKHIAKLDTLMAQQQRAVDRLTVLIERGKRTP